MLELSCFLVSASCLTLHLHLRFLRLWSEWRSCAKNGPWPGASWTMAASEWCHHTPIRCFAFVLSSERKDYTMSVWKESWMSKVREMIKNYSDDSDFFISLCSCQILNKINLYFCSAWICLSFFNFLNIETIYLWTKHQVLKLRHFNVFKMISAFMSTIFSFFQANSSVCCSSALCERDTLVSTSRRPSNAKSSLLKTQQRTLTMDFCPIISYLTRPSPELSPWLQLWETQLHCAQWDGAGEPTCMGLLIQKGNFPQ